MSVKLTNFVQISINHHLTTSTNATRDTAVVIHFYPNSPATHDDVFDAMPDTSSGTYTYLAGIDAYLAAFFNNGGAKIRVLTVKTLDETSFTTLMETLPMEQMIVGLANNGSSTPGGSLALADFRTWAAAWNAAKSDEKIFQKIFVAEIPDSTLASYISNKVEVENFVVKYGALGIGASVLAYYTSFDVYASNATQDYAFTTENYKLDTDEGGPYNYVYNDNGVVSDCIANNVNVDTVLAGTVKNIGGNDTAGYDLTNQFMLLFVHQALTTTLVQVLASKIKYNQSGIAVVLNAISAELNKFVINGYLSTDKVWTDPTLYYDGYKVIDTNTVLNLGYKVLILPFSSLTNDQKAAHQLPKIYILLADSYSIRKIVISGEVF